MRSTIIALLAGEVLLTVGLWLVWVPLALIMLGGQLTAFALLRETGARK